METQALLMNVDEVVAALGVSKPYAYRLIRKLNDELSAKGYITITGKVNRKYFLEKCYGTEAAAEVRANAGV